MSEEKSFWSTVPGILTGLAGVITAIAALLTALYTAGLIGQKSEPEVTPPSQGTQPSASQPSESDPSASPPSESPPPDAEGSRPEPEPSRPGTSTAAAESLEISSLTPASPARLAAGRDALWVRLRYSLARPATLNVIPLDAERRAIPRVGWQARNGRVWSGRVGTPIELEVAAGAGGIEVQLKAMQAAQVSTLRLRVLRGRDVALLEDVPVNFRFDP